MGGRDICSSGFCFSTTASSERLLASVATTLSACHAVAAHYRHPKPLLPLNFLSSFPTLGGSCQVLFTIRFVVHQSGRQDAHLSACGFILRNAWT